MGVHTCDSVVLWAHRERGPLRPTPLYTKHLCCKGGSLGPACCPLWKEHLDMTHSMSAHFHTPSWDNLGSRSPSLDSNRKYTRGNSTRSSPSQPPSHIPASSLPLAVLGRFGPGTAWPPNQLVLPTALTSHHGSHWL